MPTITEDLRQIHAAAVRATVDLVAHATPDDLTRPTPCAGWDLAALLGHMTAQHHGFAAAAHGRGADLTAWTPTRPDADFLHRYAEATTAVLDAFAPADVLDRPFDLPELSTDRTFPGHLALRFHLVDYVVHGWDVATTLSLPYAPSPDTLAAALPIARAVPDGPTRLAPDAAFAPAHPVLPGTDPLTEILLLLGRDPS
ncbi:TIGR03086 family metal-binding protein [Actinoplanes palleronii]|uniref:TIGR03086 family protein n=1 Tax=Actinoplanes palleronii TaxID=113570 RepID=A0ABQ4BFD1_9ACTN|nr:TIGR03086 family metal-binding protein [Actinoplanes palleronii]GIE69359.1 TIGR03086 family protein [Actinoplanes palleronii]